MNFLRTMFAFTMMSWLCVSVHADDAAEAVTGVWDALRGLDVGWEVTFQKEEGVWQLTDVSLAAGRDHVETVVDGLVGRLARFPALRSLDILQGGNRRSNWLSPAGWRQIATLSQLRRLRLDRVSADAVKAVSGLPDLQELHINSHLGDEDLIPLKRLSKLRVLSLENCPLTDAAFEHIKALEGLEELDLEYYRYITDKGLSALKGLGNLRCLRLMYIGNEGLLALKDLPRLNHLKCYNSDEAVDFSVLRGLKTLEVELGEDVKGRKILLPDNLERLTVTTDMEFDVQIQPVPKYMMHLELTTSLGGPEHKVLREWLASIPQLGELTRWDVRDDDLKAMVALKSLRRLTIGTACLGSISDEGMKALGELRQLESLELRVLRYDRISTDVWRDCVRNLQGIRELYLEGLFRERPEELAAIGELKRLRTLTLEYENLDSELSHLWKLGELEELTLRGKITDEGMKHLAGLKRLRLLDLSGTSRYRGGAISADALISLMRALPQLRVVKLCSGDPLFF